jgi:hypothetical protein
LPHQSKIKRNLGLLSTHPFAPFLDPLGMTGRAESSRLAGEGQEVFKSYENQGYKNFS